MNHASRTLAEDFAAHWISAWNSHDIEAILSHYGDDVVFLSPVAAQRTGNGRVIGREALRSYWSAGLTAQPELQFELDKVLIGFQTVTVLYRNHHNQTVAETFEFNDHGKVVSAYACYG
jgi:hypothetical protein